MQQIHPSESLVTANPAAKHRPVNLISGWSLILMWLGIQTASWFFPASGLNLFLLEPVVVLLLIGSTGLVVWMRRQSLGDFLFFSILILCFWRFMLGAIGPETGVFDDAFMFTRYARNLQTIGQIAWNPDGVPTYGLTSPLYLVVVVPIQVLLPNADPEVTISLASRISGIAFLLTLLALLWQSITLSRGPKQTTIVFVFVSLVWSGTLALNASSGMDTTFAMWLLTLYFWLLLRFVRRPTPVNVALVSILGGLLFWVRPEYTLYAACIPLGMFLFSKDGANRRQSLSFGLLTLATLSIVLLLNSLYFGTALPLPFFAKSAGLYDDPALLDYHRPVPFVMLAYFLRDYLPFVLIALFTLVRAPRKWLYAQHLSIRIIFAVTLILVAYYLLLVLQIMYFFERYYHHLLPAVAYVAALMLAYWLAPERFGSHALRIWKRWKQPLAAVVGVAACLWMLAWLSEITPTANQTPATNRLETTRYLEERSRKVASDAGYYPGLLELSQVDQPIVIASTEVGRISVLNPDFTILDIAGLNNRQVIFNGFSAEWLVAQRPDLVYLPHPQYNITNDEILRSADFQEGFDIYSSEQLHTTLGVAIRRESPHYAILHNWITAYIESLD